MLQLEIHSRGTFDVDELSEFTLKAYSDLSIPFRYGSTLTEIREFFNHENNCPDFIVIAKENEEIRGWAALYHWTKSMTYLLSWHPLVNPFESTIGIRLLSECIKYTKSTGRNRMEVFLMNLTDEHREYASKCGDQYYGPSGMIRGFEWVYMEADLTDLNFEIRDAPPTMTFRPLVDISNDALWSSYDHAFSTSGDRRYLDQTLSQRRENFESFFNRKVPMEETASLVLYDGDTVVGFVKIDLIDEGTYVHGVAVIPEYRNQGFGKFILGTSMQQAANNGRNKMILEVDIDNKTAIALYKSLGFKIIKGSISYIWKRD